jgi:hypothetical protein
MQPQDQNSPSNGSPETRQPHNNPTNSPDDQPQLVFVSRPHEPVKQEMTPEVKQRHEQSKSKFPDLNLSEGEYIISAIDRHPIGLIQIWAIVGIMLAVLFGIVAVLAAGLIKDANGEAMSASAIVLIPVLLLSTLVLLFGFIETTVYNANKFFLTNESVIQQIQTSLFSKREQTVSLSNIEDASYTQHGIVQSLFNYGMIRLSTEGDETTYRFNFASNPKQQVAILNNAVEAFKNGRPVTGD